MFYYYFRVSNSVKTAIKVFDYEVNTHINKWFVELTDEQREFYLEHPTASVREVELCELFPPYVPPVIPIEELKEQAVQEIDSLSRSTISGFVDTLGFANAVATSLYAKSKGLTPVYDDNQVLSTASVFLEKGRICRLKYVEYAGCVEGCDSEVEINHVMDEARDFYASIAEDEDSVEKHRTRKLIDIDVYDNSDHVNGFYYNGMFMWLDKSTRVGLVNTLNSADELGRETVNIWYNNQVCLELDVESARMLLAAIELYATDCYNVTASHKKSVSEMDNIEEIDAFDITAGYPPMLHLGDEINNEQNE